MKAGFKLIRLLIADDEYLVTDSIKYIIERNIKDVEVVGTAGSGREAVEKTMDLKPDVVFMDIHMPGINGIDAIRQIKAVHPDILFVILTAYEYFNYAKEAVNLGVFEYLLKPINRDKVIETISNAGAVILNRKEAVQREIALKEKINRLVPLMEGQLIYTQLFNEGTITDIEFYEEMFDMKINHGYVLLAKLEEAEGAVKEESIKHSLARQKFFDVLRMELKNLARCLVGPPLLDRMIAYVPSDKDIDGYNIRNSAIEMARRAAEKTNRTTDIKYRIGIGRSYCIERFSNSYNEAYMAASVAGGGIVTHFEDTVASAACTDDYPTDREKQLINRIVAGDERGAMEAFEGIYNWLALNCRGDMDRIKSRLIELLFVLHRSIPYVMNEDEASAQRYLNGMLKIQSSSEMMLSFQNQLKRMINAIAVKRQNDLSGLVPKVIKYIEENYHKNISLDDAAKEINLSYHYFSKLFKESVGKSFVDYLTELRIEKSKELLQDAAISIKEICYRTGYSDPNYYCKIFKKVTGMTPTEYRSGITSNEVMNNGTE